MFLTCTGIECGIFSGQRTALLYDVAKQHPSGLSCHFCSDIICTSPLYHLRRTSLTKPRPAHTNWLLHLEDQNNGYSYLKICKGGGTTRSQRAVHRCNYCSVRTGRRVGASRQLPTAATLPERHHWICRGCYPHYGRQNTDRTDLRNSWVLQSSAQFGFCAPRKCVYIYSEVYTYTQGGAPEIQTPTQWALIARIITAMPPVLSSSSILPPHSRKENFGAHYNDLCVSFEIIKTYSKFNIWAKLGPSALASHFSTNTTNPQ